MMLFLVIFKVEIEIRYGGWSGVMLSSNILDDRRAEDALPRTRWEEAMKSNKSPSYKNVRFPWIHINEPFDSHSLKIVSLNNHTEVLSC